jgi:hemoglobin
MNNVAWDNPWNISEEMIHQLVHGFYAKVRADETLGPIFNRAIGDNWDAHLEKMCAFWSSVMLTSGRYKGNPMVAHMRLKMVRPEHFQQWLALFRMAAHELFAPAIAQAFIIRAENIARSLQLGMFFKPETKAAAR